MAEMVTDGIARWVCPACGVRERRTRRPRTDARMKANVFQGGRRAVRR